MLVFFVLVVIQELFGHSNFNTTADVYSHVDFSAKIESAKIIDKTITRNNDAEKTISDCIAFLKS